MTSDAEERQLEGSGNNENPFVTEQTSLTREEVQPKGNEGFSFFFAVPLCLLLCGGVCCLLGFSALGVVFALGAIDWFCGGFGALYFVVFYLRKRGDGPVTQNEMIAELLCMCALWHYFLLSTVARMALRRFSRVSACEICLFFCNFYPHDPIVAGPGVPIQHGADTKEEEMRRKMLGQDQYFTMRQCLHFAQLVVVYYYCDAFATTLPLVQQVFVCALPSLLLLWGLMHLLAVVTSIRRLSPYYEIEDWIVAFVAQTAKLPHDKVLEGNVAMSQDAENGDVEEKGDVEDAFGSLGSEGYVSSASAVRRS